MSSDVLKTLISNDFPDSFGLLSFAVSSKCLALYETFFCWNFGMIPQLLAVSVAVLTTDLKSFRYNLKASYAYFNKA
jgi:hypothetical protein